MVVSRRKTIFNQMKINDSWALIFVSFVLLLRGVCVDAFGPFPEFDFDVVSFVEFFFFFLYLIWQFPLAFRKIKFYAFFQRLIFFKKNRKSKLVWFG